MTLRESLDLSEVMKVVVRPVLGALIEPGELDSVTLGWRAVRVPGWASDPDAAGLTAQVVTKADLDRLLWVDVVRLVVDLTVRGEGFGFQIADGEDDDALGEEGVDLDWKAKDFYDELQDFIAESRFGWGQLRTGRMS